MKPKPLTILGTSKVPGFDITGLAPGQTYTICVIAVNGDGESQPLCTEVDIPNKGPGKNKNYKI